MFIGCVVLDRLQYLTFAGYKEACSLPSLKSKSLNRVTCEDVPADFLFKVSHKAMTHKPNNLIISQHIRAEHPYPTSEAIDNLVTVLCNHIRSLASLRRCESINLLILCCEQPVLVFDLLLRLCKQSDGFAVSFNFVVVDKNKDVQEIGSQILKDIDTQPNIITFVEENFLVFDNNRMADFDVAIALASNVSELFVMKFSLLPFVNTTRPYYRCSKMFLATKSLFDKFKYVLSSTVHKKNIHFHTELVASHECNDGKEVVKNICRLKEMKISDVVTNSFLYHFEYHFNKNDASVEGFKESSLHQMFCDLVVDQALKLSFQFAHLFSQNHLFGDVIVDQHDDTFVQRNKEYHRDFTCAAIGICNICLDFDSVSIHLKSYTAAQNEFAISYQTLNSSGEWLQDNLRLHYDEETSPFLHEYLSNNVFNLSVCLHFLSKAQNRFINTIFISVNETFLDSHAENVRENAIATAHFLFSKYKTRCELQRIFQMQTIRSYFSDFVIWGEYEIFTLDWSTKIVKLAKRKRGEKQIVKRPSVDASIGPVIHMKQAAEQAEFTWNDEVEFFGPADALTTRECDEMFAFSTQDIVKLVHCE